MRRRATSGAILLVIATATSVCSAPPPETASPAATKLGNAMADILYKEGILKSLRCDLQSAFVDHIEWQRHSDLQQLNLANGLSVACGMKERISIYAAFDTERRKPLRLKSSGMD